MSCLEQYVQMLEEVPLSQGGGFAASILEFPGCYAQGDSAEEALESLQGAAESWMAAVAGQGQEVPQPLRQRTDISLVDIQRILNPKSRVFKPKILKFLAGVIFRNIE